MTAAKHCMRCGGDFSCGREDPTCWCAALPSLPPTALAVNDDCLCPACLSAALAPSGVDEKALANVDPIDPDHSA